MIEQPQALPRREHESLAHTAAGRELVGSLGVLGAVLAFALLGLAIDGNWPKVLRVGVAAGAYLALVPALARRRPVPAGDDTYPYVVFAVAGALAGVCGSALRPEGAPPLVVAIGMLGMAGLFGGTHWLALRTLRRMRAAH